MPLFKTPGFCEGSVVAASSARRAAALTLSRATWGLAAPGHVVAAHGDQAAVAVVVEAEQLAEHRQVADALLQVDVAPARQEVVAGAAGDAELRKRRGKAEGGLVGLEEAARTGCKVRRIVGLPAAREPRHGAGGGIELERGRRLGLSLEAAKSRLARGRRRGRGPGGRGERQRQAQNEDEQEHATVHDGPLP